MVTGFLVSVGFGDICPGNYSDPLGDVFLFVLPLMGLGFFCGPILTMSSSWQSRVPGGVLSLGSLTLALGVSMLTVFEGMALKDAIHLSIMTGTLAQSFYCRNKRFLGCSDTNRSTPLDAKHISKIIRYYDRVRIFSGVV